MYLAVDVDFDVFFAVFSVAVALGLPFQMKPNKMSPKQRLGLKPD